MLDVELRTRPATTDDITRWRRHFEARRRRHANLPTTPANRIDPTVVAGLRASLPTFQLGETGDGSHLQRAMDRYDVSDDYRCCLELFVTEESEHARLLGEVMASLGISVLDHHWTDIVFRFLRRFGGLEIELATMMIAEMVAVHFYRVLRDGVGDPALAAVFGHIRDDEAVHVAFHTATLPSILGATPGWRRSLFRSGHRLATLCSVVVVAFDHRLILRACGVPPRCFVAEARQGSQWALEQMWRRPCYDPPKLPH